MFFSANSLTVWMYCAILKVQTHATDQMCPSLSKFHVMKITYLPLLKLIIVLYASVCYRVTEEIQVLQVHLVPKEMAILVPW